MKLTITDVVVHRLSVPLPRPVRTARHDHAHADTVAVEMRTDAGLVGAGYCFAFGARRARALAELVEDLAETYVGRAPAPQARHAEAWRALNFIGHAGLSLIALAALDTACWDLAARAANLPLFRFLGGDRARVPTYASGGLWIDGSLDALLREAEDFRTAGHRAMKMRVGRANPDDDVERVRIVREALGGDAALLADVNQGWDEPTPIRVGRRLEEHDLYWLEEPLPYDDLAGCARVAAALDMRIATGETDYGSAGMKRHLEARAADVLMPDLQPVSSHLFTETSAHLLAATPNALILEHMSWWEPLFTEPVTIDAGCVVLSDKPGIGCELSQAALERYKV